MVTNEIKEEITRYLEMHDNENKTSQNLMETAKAILREKFIELEAYLKKQEKSQINNLISCLKNWKTNNKQSPK